MDDDAAGPVLTGETPQQRVCPRCQHPVLRASWTHCGSCGTPLDAPAAPAPPAGPPQGRWGAHAVPAAGGASPGAPAPADGSGGDVPRWAIPVLAAVILVLAAVVAAVVLHSGKKPAAAASTSAGATPPAPAGPPGTPVHGAGFSLTLPDGWALVPLSKASIRDFYLNSMHLSPGAADLLSNLVPMEVAQGEKMLGVKSGSGDLPTSFGVFVTSAASPGDRSAAAGRISSELTQAGARDVTSTPTTVAGLPAVETEFVLAIPLPGTALYFNHQRYDVFAGGHDYRVDFETTDISADSDDISAIMASFRATGGQSA